MMCTAPRLVPPSSSPGAPAAMSGMPSRLMSPTEATEEPKKSPLTIEGPVVLGRSLISTVLSMVSMISTVLCMVPLAFISSMCTVPALMSAASSLGAPTLMSGMPSRLMSPTEATEEPKKSPLTIEGPFVVFEVPLISTVLFMVPSGFISIMWTAPASRLPASLRGTPATISGMPSRLMSPVKAAEAPKLSPSESKGPFAVEEFISILSCSIPLVVGTGPASDITCTAPRSVPPASSPAAPAAISGIPSSSKSPIRVIDEPKPSEFKRSRPSEA